MPLRQRLMTTVSNPSKKPGVSSWAVVTRVTDAAPNSAVRLKGMPFPPPPGFVSPSSQTAKRGAAAPMEGTRRITTNAHAATNLSQAITLLSPRAYACAECSNQRQGCKNLALIGSHYLQLLTARDELTCKANRQDPGSVHVLSSHRIEDPIVLIGDDPQVRLPHSGRRRYSRYQILDEVRISRHQDPVELVPPECVHVVQDVDRPVIRHRLIVASLPEGHPAVDVQLRLHPSADHVPAPVIEVESPADRWVVKEKLRQAFGAAWTILAVRPHRAVQEVAVFHSPFEN